MVPVPARHISTASSTRYAHVLFFAFSTAFRYVVRCVKPAEWGSRNGGGVDGAGGGLRRRSKEIDHDDPKFIVFVVLIPVLVLMSGLFAGLTLGYMSLDETQLNVLSISGTPEQRVYASKIKPIRKNGHLLLVTLLLANMIVNESLPVIADPVLGGGVQSVVVSTVLIVIFSEIIPQSLFTRHGLYLGAKMAGFTTVLIYALGIVSWPVAKFLEFVLGPHHGIIYRRAELKELIAMHSSHAPLGGDLKVDTVTIIGATLDLQEKVVKQAMTPIDDVFMLSIDSKLDYNLLKQICETGHSRVPVYEELEIPIPQESPLNGHEGVLPTLAAIAGAASAKRQRTQKVKKILGIFLVKHCVLLDPNDATPIRNMPLNKVPFVPNNEPLLRILDIFQEGRSHMAIVSRFSVDKAQSVKKAVKRGLTQRLRDRVGMGDTSDSSSDSSGSPSSSSEDEEKSSGFTRIRKKAGLKKSTPRVARSSQEEEDGEYELGSVTKERSGNLMDGNKPGTAAGEDEKGTATGLEVNIAQVDRKATKTRVDRSKKPKIQKVTAGMGSSAVPPLEQSMPADAVLTKEGADEFLQNVEPAVMPLGIITLEDVLEELIGEEIYDEFDVQGAHGDPYQIPVLPVGNSVPQSSTEYSSSTLALGKDCLLNAKDNQHPVVHPIPILKPTTLGLKGLGFLRPRSAPPVQRANTNPGGSSKAFKEAETLNKSVDEKQERVVPSLPSALDGDSSASTDEVRTIPPLVETVPTVGMIPHLGGRRSAPATRAPSPMGFGFNTHSTSTTPKGPAGALNPVQMGMTLTSRSNSPPPSLEAVLLERKRRLLAAGGIGAGSNTNSATAAPATGTTSAVPGTGNLAPPGLGLLGNSGVGSGSGSGVGAAVGGTSMVSRMGHAHGVRGSAFKSSPLTVPGEGTPHVPGVPPAGAAPQDDGAAPAAA